MKRGTIVNTQELSLAAGDPVLFCRHLAGGMTPDQPNAVYAMAALVPLIKNPPPAILLCCACTNKLIDVMTDDETAPAERDGEVRLSRSASARTRRRRGVR